MRNNPYINEQDLVWGNHRSWGIYYDDVRKNDNIRAILGVQIPTKLTEDQIQKALDSDSEKKLKFSKIPNGKCLRCTFPWTSKLSYVTAPPLVYAAFEKYTSEKGLHRSEFPIGIEMYDEPGKKYEFYYWPDAELSKVLW